eukprot:5939989-Amphidinium_carterae.1
MAHQLECRLVFYKHVMVVPFCLGAVGTTLQLLPSTFLAGITPLQRLAEWAPVAVDGGPFLAAIAYIEACIAATKAYVEPLRAPGTNMSVGELLVGLQAQDPAKFYQPREELRR